MNAHSPAPQIDEAPSFFTGTSFSVEEAVLGLRVLEAKVRALKTAHTAQSAAGMKMAAEDVAKVSKQIGALTDHLAGVCVRHLNRKPR